MASQVKQKSSKNNSFKTLFSNIEKEKIDHVYVFHGLNRIVIDRALKVLKEKIVGENEDLAYFVFRGGESKALDILSSAKTIPMLTEKQLVVVRNADQLKAEELSLFLPYLESPNPSTSLVFLGTKFDKRTKFYVNAKKRGMAYEAQEITERELPGWIGARAKHQGLKMGQQAIQMLAEAIGNDLPSIEDALERLSLFIGEQVEIKASHVNSVVVSNRIRSIFDLTDAIGRRDVAVALRTLDNMLDHREVPLRLLATLATHMRRLLVARELGVELLNQPFRLASEMKVSTFLARKIADQARHFSVAELRNAMIRISRTDIELKSSRRPDKLIMEEMVLDLCIKKRPKT